MLDAFKRCYDKDSLLCISLILLFFIGCLLACTSTPYVSERLFHNPWHYFMRHLLHVALSGVVFAVAIHVPAHWYVKYRWMFLLVGYTVLIVLFIPAIAPKINGARRWLQFPGFMLQTSDVSKLAFVIFLSGFFHQSANRSANTSLQWYLPLGFLAVFVCLLLYQPDLGTSIVLVTIVLHMLFVAGMPINILSWMLTLSVSSALILVLIAPYRMSRVISFLNPWKYAYTSGYQLTQSLMAIGRGGLWGVGMGDGLQKIHYLPEAHTDFVYAVLCEEFGLIAGGALIALYGVIFYRLLGWSSFFQQKGDYFSCLYSLGLAVWLLSQSAISMGVNMGLLPTKGLVLPFLSYGGSHMLLFAYAMGVFFHLMLHEGLKAKWFGQKRGAR